MKAPTLIRSSERNDDESRVQQISLEWPLELPWGNRYSLQTEPALEEALLSGAAVAIGVSGGKDSRACAIAVNEHLDRITHRGPQILIHADLGRVEWR